MDFGRLARDGRAVRGSLPRSGHRRTSTRGFSQVEVLIAVFVLSVGILGVLGAFAYGMEASNHSARLSEAVGYARQLVELVRSRNLPFQGSLPPAASSGLNDASSTTWSSLKELHAAPFAVDLPPNTGFRRLIQVSRVSNTVTDYRYDIARIRVVVFWREKNRQKQFELVAEHRKP